GTGVSGSVERRAPSLFYFFFYFRGRFSIVKKCVHKASRKDVAVKFISKKMKKKEQAAHEAALLQHLQHPQYITIHDTYESPTSYILVLELMDDGRLLDYLMNHDELMEEKVAFYIRDTMEALQYLHNCRVAHLDIKVGRKENDAILFSNLITGHYHIHHLLGNPEFAAPEVIQGLPVSLSTDIWSIGVLTYVMLSGVSPFLDESKEETCINVCRVDFSFPPEYFSDVSHAARDFINVILQEEFRRRPTAATCLQHPWLQPHNGSYSKIPLDTSRLASFIEHVTPLSLGSYTAGPEARCRERAGAKQICLYIVPYSAFAFHVASLTAGYKSLRRWQYLPSSSGPKQSGERWWVPAPSPWDPQAPLGTRGIVASTAKKGLWEANTNWKQEPKLQLP
uniref:Protein kinase domain-containing protein n=1 Tax=Buteo japonicus TaxID=224669 RepID=A0A8C0B125_9AVES